MPSGSISDAFYTVKAMAMGRLVRERGKAAGHKEG